MALRSDAWYSGQDRNSYIHRAWMRRGLPNSAFQGRPQIAIANTASDLTPCNSHLNEVAEHVKRGIWEAGGVPLEAPVPSLGENQLRPTAMSFRNLAAMAIEEGVLGHRRPARQPLPERRDPQALRSHPVADEAPRQAVVFDSVEDLHARRDDPDLDIDENCVMVLRGCGPKGYPGMPEVGNMPLLEQGVRDMVRISDARMSGTAYGTVVLHVAPEAAAGGPLALVRTGDMIELDVQRRVLHLEVDEEELALRTPPESFTTPSYERGWAKLYTDHVLQADKGADLDFLVGGSGDAIVRGAY
jgi:dihydroxy-acid dehydratase